MNTIDSSYSIVFQCDNRTSLSVVLSLLAAIATAVALGVLAHYGYITPTTAYATAPAIGTLLTTIGVAVALIRRDTARLEGDETPFQVEVEPSADFISETHKRLDSVRNVWIKAYSTDLSDPLYLKHEKPSKTVPYHSLKIQLELDGGAGIEVEVIRVHQLSEYEVQIVFQWQGKEYTKYLKGLAGSEYQRVCEKVNELKQKNLLFRVDYEKLMDPRGPATLLMSYEQEEGSNGTAYFGMKEFTRAHIEGFLENSIAIFTRKDTTPIRSLEGLDDHPEICKMLQATSWKWRVAYIWSIEPGTPPDHVSYDEEKHGTRQHIIRWKT